MTSPTTPTLTQPNLPRHVPNELPTIHNQPYRIAFIGEAPGAEEDACGKPFSGTSGRLLWGVASRYGIVRDACFVGNVCQIRPPGNHIEVFSWTGDEIQSGLAQLWTDLAKFRPNLCVLLGNTPLRAFTGEQGITSWRGSLIKGSQFGYKCLASLHPAAILREYSGMPLFNFDMRRARQEGESPDLRLPERVFETDLSVDEQLAKLDWHITNKAEASIDLEGYWNNMTCISVCDTPYSGFLIKFHNYLSEYDEGRLWRKLAQLLGDKSVPKTLQNACYELFVLGYGHRIPIRGISDDTMLAHWELYCEMPKNLGLQASIYTKEPYWKDQRTDVDMHTRDVYCCKDSAVTMEIRNVLRKQLTPAQLTHYQFNLDLLDPVAYMEQKGILYDKVKAAKKLADCQRKIARLQHALNLIAGVKIPTTVAGWVEQCRDALCFKKSSAFVNLVADIVPHSKVTCLHLSTRVTELLSQDLTLDAHGELSMLTDLALNVESKLQLADFLYRQLNLPIQYKKEKGRLTTKETTDVLALLNLYKKTNDPTLKLVLTIRALRTRVGTLESATDPDGRIRCGYNLVGTETGRLTCYESPTGSGFNLQTVTKKDRDLFLPDAGYWFFQCDLSGADGWTVAAHCHSCGDSTMLDDLQAKLKIAKNIALLYLHGTQVLTWTRDKLREAGLEIDPDGWLYFASKRVFHGSDYGMRGNTMSDQILKDSYKLFGEPIMVEPSVCDRLQSLFFARYPGVLRWHAKCTNVLKAKGSLTSANGHTRVFFGRRDDHATFKQFLADEPQNNTTYATNLALHKLWSDPNNRVNSETPEDGGPAIELFRPRRRIQPLHQVHDALIGQFRKEDTEWACGKIRSYFANTLTIAGIPIVIPFEGAYGESWGNLKQGVI